MRDNIRKFLLNIDFKIYLIKWRLARLYAIIRLNFEKDPKERDKLFALYIYEPFSSKYQTPMPNIIEDICKIIKKG